MNVDTPRLRMFAGPNGSGKSTFKTLIRQELLGIYVNPDDIERDMHNLGYFDLKPYGITAHRDEVLGFFRQSSLLEKVGDSKKSHLLLFNDQKVIFDNLLPNAYFASVASDFIRQKLIENSKSLTFETVMSFPDKIEFLRNAQLKGYRTYLYYVATENPEINISRVRYRVSRGGHHVPEDKIIGRYKRSLELLRSAVMCTHRAYIFDNSTHEHVWLAEITNGQTLEMKTDHTPLWFNKIFDGYF